MPEITRLVVDVNSPQECSEPGSDQEEYDDQQKHFSNFALSRDTKVLLLAFALVAALQCTIIIGQSHHQQQSAQATTAPSFAPHRVSSSLQVPGSGPQPLVPAISSARTLEAMQTVPDYWPCRKGEEIFGNLCYKTCGSLTDGSLPYRWDGCTCCSELPCPLFVAGKFNLNCTMLNKNSTGGDPIAPQLTVCENPDEELFMGLCYLKCSVLTYARLPIRTGMNTCSRNNNWAANWTMGFGPCSGFGIGSGLSKYCWPAIPQVAVE